MYTLLQSEYGSLMGAVPVRNEHGTCIYDTFEEARADLINQWGMTATLSYAMWDDWGIDEEDKPVTPARMEGYAAINQNTIFGVGDDISRESTLAHLVRRTAPLVRPEIRNIPSDDHVLLEWVSPFLQKVSFSIEQATGNLVLDGTDGYCRCWEDSATLSAMSGSATCWKIVHLPSADIRN